MTQEEKAKAYDEALEKAKRLFDGKDKAPKEPILEYLFPELRESEDERTRKAIINYFECQKRDEPTRAALLDKWIAYLEKQKEQKPDDDPLDDPKFLKGFDTGREVQRIFDEKKPAEWKPSGESMEALLYAIEGKWESIRPTSYLSRRLEDLYEGLVNTFNIEETWLNESSKVTYTTEDIEGLRALRCKIEASREMKPAEWSEEDEQQTDKVLNDYALGRISSAAVKIWFKSLRPQPKAEWSAADEETLNDAIGVVENYGYLSLARRLKSIHPQPIDERLRSGELLTQEHHQKLMDALHDTMLKGEEERTKLLAKEYEENLEKAYKNRDEVVFREGKEKGREEMMEEMEARETQSHAKGYDAGLKDGIAMAKAEYEKEWVAELEKKYPDLDGYKQGVSDGRLLSQITADDVGKIFNLVRIMQKKYAATEGCFQPVADKFNEERK